jgi:hypothetical protein
MVYRETFVQRDRHPLYVREYPGEEPAIVLMHGFPDNLHLYDRLTPCLFVTTDRCYTASIDGEAIGGPTLKAEDGRVVRNLLHTFECCFDTM